MSRDSRRGSFSCWHLAGILFAPVSRKCSAPSRKGPFLIFSAYRVECRSERNIPDVDVGGRGGPSGKSCFCNRRPGGCTSSAISWHGACITPPTSRMGSWRICEKVSISLVSRHPGDRHWNDLLGQRASSPKHTAVIDAGSNGTAVAAASIAGNAAVVAADA